MAAGLSQQCSISSSWPSLCGCCWKESSCTVWWCRSSMPQSGLSTCLWLVMGFPWWLPPYPPALDHKDTAQRSSRCSSMCWQTPCVISVLHTRDVKEDQSFTEAYFFLPSCWLDVNDGLIWSFFGPVCFIIILNVFFFIITVWKLAQKFTSLNPDLSSLHKIRSVLFFVFFLAVDFLTWNYLTETYLSAYKASIVMKKRTE